MKKPLIIYLHLFIKAVFVLHLLLVTFLALFNYYDISASDPEWTARGQVNVLPSGQVHPGPTDVQGEEITVTRLDHSSAFVRFDFRHFSGLINSWAGWTVLCDLANLFSGLWVTWLLLKVASSVRQGEPFSGLNISRLRLMALAVGLIFMFRYMRDYSLTMLCREFLKGSGEQYFSHTPLHIMTVANAVIPVILILIITELIKAGWELKREQDLTI